TILITVTPEAREAHLRCDALECATFGLVLEHLGMRASEPRLGECCARTRRKRSAQLATSPLRDATTDPGEGFPDIGLMHDTYHRTNAIVQCDQRPPMQLPDDEAAGAVDGIDDPGVARRALSPTVLLAANAMVGIGAHDG